MSEKKNVLIGHEGHSIQFSMLPGTSEEKEEFGLSIQVQIEGFQLTKNTSCNKETFEWFVNGLQQIYEKLNGEAVLDLIDEEYVIFYFRPSTTGQIAIQGEMRSAGKDDIKCNINYQLDQSYLPQIIEGFKSWLVIEN